MDSTDLDVLKTIALWQAEGASITLATLVKTWGSAPRPVGSLLALTRDGRLVGSLSGGCIEDDLLEQVRTRTISLPEKISYGISTEQASRFGLPCGGELELILEPLHAQSAVKELLVALSQNAIVARELDLSTGMARIVPADAAANLTVTEHLLRSVHGPRWRLLIIGAGQLSRYLSEMALALDYQVLLCDPRAEFRKSWPVHLPEVDSSMPDDFVAAQKPDPHTAIVALTHDPKQDDLALLEALKSRAFYVGAIGSKANQAKRRERLSLFDLTPEQIGALHGPAGLPIGSRTPPEMAISILAEITAIRHGAMPSLSAAQTTPP
ncbi:MAG: XdhC family protein [Betaproteobacteria bacterium]|nr:XdhC family protein [Betaproteobacteria bacterium]MDE2622140.1 XdhC family protein [Betaproteobacteria bacterium]